jgi:hypothetical protein
MSLYDKSSLVLIPSGTKTGKVYSQKPVSGDGDFTFTRASAATRISANGNIEKETGNLLLQSNSFNTTWINSNSTESSGQSGYDGTSDAWLLESTATSTSSYLKQNISNSGVYTMSVYAKAGTSDWLSLNTAGNQSAYFYLANGVLGSKSSNVVDSSIESIGNGWYRCSATLVDNNDFYVFIANGDGNLTTNSGDNILIQDAQLEQGLVARDFITTTTAALYGGITDNVPRLDYTDSSCPSLKLEPQRTNIVTQSEYFGAWTNYNASAVLSEETIYGETAYKIVEDSTLNYHGLYLHNLFSANGTNYIWSVYVKGGERRYVVLTGRSGISSNDSAVIFDTQDGVWTLDSSSQNQAFSAESVGNGWWRIAIEGDPTSGAYDSFTIAASLGGSSYADANYQGDGTSGIYVAMAQLEAGSYPTSFVSLMLVRLQVQVVL